MPPSTNAEAYEYARQIMDQALFSDKGLLIECKSREDAQRVRWDCYSARRVARKLSEEIHPEGDPQRGKSDYDNLRFSIKGQNLKIEPQASMPVEDIRITEIT